MNLTEWMNSPSRDSGREQYIFAQRMKGPAEDYAAYIHAAIGEAASDIWRSMQSLGEPHFVRRNDMSWWST